MFGGDQGSWYSHCELLPVAGGRVELLPLGAVVSDSELVVCGRDTSKGTSGIPAKNWSKVILQTPFGNRMLER